MADGEVFQIFHRGQDVKVMMTQEYFFKLMARLEKAEGITKTSKYNPEQLMSDFESKMDKLNDILGKVELRKGKAVPLNWKMRILYERETKKIRIDKYFRKRNYN